MFIQEIQLTFESQKPLENTKYILEASFVEYLLNRVSK